MLRIPPRIFWPGLVISILLLSVVANVVLVVLSARGGGPQVIPDYYQRGLDWDSERDRLRNVSELGLRVAVLFAADELIVTVTDEGGQGVEGLEARVTVRHPMLVEPELTATLLPHGTAGLYRTDASAVGTGKRIVEVDGQWYGKSVLFVDRLDRR